MVYVFVCVVCGLHVVYMCVVYESLCVSCIYVLVCVHVCVYYVLLLLSVIIPCLSYINRSLSFPKMV